MLSTKIVPELYMKTLKTSFFCLIISVKNRTTLSQRRDTNTNLSLSLAYFEIDKMGHSNDTWHFFCPPPPPRTHVSFWDTTTYLPQCVMTFYFFICRSIFFWIFKLNQNWVHELILEWILPRFHLVISWDKIWTHDLKFCVKFASKPLSRFNALNNWHK
jgi:hypothetical protein